MRTYALLIVPLAVLIYWLLGTIAQVMARRKVNMRPSVGQLLLLFCHLAAIAGIIIVMNHLRGLN